MWLCPSYHLSWVSPFPLDIGVYVYININTHTHTHTHTHIYSGIQHSPVDGCSTVSCSSWIFPGGDECRSFYSTILFSKTQTGTRRKEQWPHKTLTQTRLWVSRSHQQRCVLALACYTVGGTECSSECMGHLKEVTIIFNSSTIVWPKVKQRGNTAPPINRKLE